MLLLGFRLDNDLKLEFENNFENDLLFVENIMSFMEAIKSRKYEAIVIDERNSKEDALINLIFNLPCFPESLADFGNSGALLLSLQSVNKPPSEFPILLPDTKPFE